MTVSYAYNANQQLTKLTIPTVGDITQSDFNWLAPQKVTYPNGVQTKYQFDALMRIKQIHTQKGTTDIMNYGYIYDKVGNIMQKTTEYGNYQYAYDKAYRLKSAINPTLDNESYDDWFSQAVNFLLESCKRQEEKVKNCIRKCLVAEDEKARDKSECQLKKCNGGICTKRKCIDDYHYKCFEKYKVPKRCYGGEYDTPVHGWL